MAQPSPFFQQANQNLIANKGFIGPVKPAAQQGFIGPVKPAVLGTSTSVVSGGRSGSAAPTPSPASAIATAGQFTSNVPSGPSPEELASIDAEFNAALGAADQSEGYLRQEAGLRTSQAEEGYAPAKTQIQQEGARRTEDLTSQATNQQARSQSAVEQARQLYRELGQGNNAYLAAGGISSSSVAEALSERLGRETASRIAGITGETNEVLGNIDKEKGRVVEFTQTKLTDLERELANAKSNIQLALQQGLGQISSARSLATTQKASARAEVARQAKAQAEAAQQQATQFAQQLYMWQTQRQAALDDSKNYVVNTPKAPDLNSQLSQLKNFQGLGIGVPAGYESLGVQPGTIIPRPKTKDEEDTGLF